MAKDARRPGSVRQGSVRDRRARCPGARPRDGSGQGPGLGDLSQRLADEGGALARHPVPARAGARGGRRRRRHRPGRRGLERGARVGLGWHGGHCGYCASCRRGDFLMCQVSPQIPGITFDGGHADYVVAPAVALARIPEGLSATDAGPLMCAGITTFNSLRHAGARSGRPRGGAGHRRPRPPRRPVRGADGLRDRRDRARQGQGAARPQARRAPLHRQPGPGPREGAGRARGRPGRAGHRHERQGDDGGRSGGWASTGRSWCSGPRTSRSRSRPLLLIWGRRRVVGWPSGTSADSEDTLAFSARHGVRPMNELFPLERAA